MNWLCQNTHKTIILNLFQNNTKRRSNNEGKKNLGDYFSVYHDN